MNGSSDGADVIVLRVSAAVDAWLHWLPTWSPSTHRGRSRMCRRCAGSPVLAAVGLETDVPHQVAHALSTRVQRIIDREVDDFTEAQLPLLHAELTGEELWNTPGFDPAAGLAPEFEAINLDPEVEGDQPYLFTLAELAEQTKPDPPLPRPPLNPEEKHRLRQEIELADRHAENIGQRVCFALMEHRPHIQIAIKRYVEPQIQAILQELTRHLEYPGA